MAREMDTSGLERPVNPAEVHLERRPIYEVHERRRRAALADVAVLRSGPDADDLGGLARHAAALPVALDD